MGGQGDLSGMGDGSLAVVERGLHAVNQRDGTSLEALSLRAAGLTMEDEVRHREPPGT